MKKFYVLVSFVLLSQLFISSCKEDEPATPSLYTRLGGANAIAAVVDKFIGYVASDPAMVRTFQPLLEDVGKGNTVRVTALRNNLINQIGEASGGPEKYTGKDMVTAHKGMNITEDEFNALVGNLVKALNDFSVPAAEQTELLNVLGGLKSQIVGQ